MTLFLGSMGEVTSLKGSKLSMAFMIRVEVPGRVRTRIDMQLMVASTIKASLQYD